MYAQHEMNCHSCVISNHGETDSDCRRCYFSQVPAINDRFFTQAVRPYCWFAAVMLFLSYIIGLWFTLRTHAAVIWNTEIDEKKAQPQPGMHGSIVHHADQHFDAPDLKHHSGSSKGTVGRNEIRGSQLYKRILGQSLSQVRLGESRQSSAPPQGPTGQSPKTPHLVPPRSNSGDAAAGGDNSSLRSVHISGLSDEENALLVRQVAEIAATAATVAARDAARAPRKASAMSHTSAHETARASAPPTAAFRDHVEGADAEALAGHGESGAHDAPNWSRLKSAIILLGATILYAVIAEILVNTVDVVLESVEINEKFLGITLFALVPNTTEFLVRILSADECTADGVICLERHLLRYERQHCTLHGDRFGVCAAGLFATDSSTRAVQRHSWTVHRPWGSDRSHLQVSWRKMVTSAVADVHA